MYVAFGQTPCRTKSSRLIYYYNYTKHQQCWYWTKLDFFRGSEPEVSFPRGNLQIYVIVLMRYSSEVHEAVFPPNVLHKVLPIYGLISKQPLASGNHHPLLHYRHSPHYTGPVGYTFLFADTYKSRYLVKCFNAG